MIKILAYFTYFIVTVSMIYLFFWFSSILTIQKSQKQKWTIKILLFLFFGGLFIFGLNTEIKKHHFYDLESYLNSPYHKQSEVANLCFREFVKHHENFSYHQFDMQTCHEQDNVNEAQKYIDNKIKTHHENKQKEKQLLKKEKMIV